MQTSEPAVRAAIDIGSNTTHLVIAKCSPERLAILVDEVKMIRTGASVSKTGELSAEIIAAVLDTLRNYQNLAQQHGAETILIAATEAVRQAHNSEAFLATVEQETGLHIDIISGKTEAVLTFYGATYSIEASKDAAVLDVGGGSSELILSQQGHPIWLKSLPIGSSKVHAQYTFSNPPSHQEIMDVANALAQSLQHLGVPFLPRALVVTGSSALALLQIAQRAFRLDERQCKLTREDLLRCEGLLCALPAKNVAQRYEQELERCLILPGGALIIQSFMEKLRCDSIYVSSHGVREGMLLAYTRYGDAWLRHPDISGEMAPQKQQQEEPLFIDVGRDVLLKRVKKMIDWRDKVLQDDDIEAVHKMRVASRRLRATLDAYEACCQPKQFKKVYREIKDLADRLGAVRDTDVMIAHLQNWIEGMPEAEHEGVCWLIERLEAYRQGRFQAMEAKVRSLDEISWQQKIMACFSEEAEGGLSHG